ncbi:hypothetical protein N7444_006951 [Penicillium canescens]|nr:hypothetical protein N7444_006951 [Penicillium canescens]
MDQIPLTASRTCDQFWDSHNAWLSPCALPYLACIPAIVALLVALSHVLGYFSHWRPKWTVPFVSELRDTRELPLDAPKQPLRWTIALLICSVIGLLAETVQSVPPDIDMSVLVLVFSWATASILIATKRPRSCSISLLVYYIFAFAIELSLAAHPDLNPKYKIIARYIAAGAAAAACLTILLMPFRESSLQPIDISAVGQQPSSDFRTPEDNLKLWQFLTVSWMAPLISTGCKRQLNEQDVWHLGFEFQHRRLHERFRCLRGSVVSRLLRANGIDVFIVSAISTVQMLCDFSTPVLLQQLLRAMKDPTRPKRVPLTYALLSFALRLVAAQSQVLLLWYGRRCYERSRGEMIMMVYEKALSRKNILGLMVEGKPEAPNEETNEAGNETLTQETQTSSGKAGTSLWRRITQKTHQKAEQKKAKEAASLGKIFNLLRGDVYEVAQRFWEVDSLIDKPLGLVIATVLVWTLFGPSCFLGILAVLVAQAVNALITRALLRWERVRRAATDTRLQITSQFVEAIRHLRWYGWQNHWLQQVMEARQHELNIRIVTSLWSILIRFVNAFASGVFPVVALYAYTFLAGHELRIDIIFPALQLFTMLESRLRDIPGLITSLINAFIALGRIEDFMSEPDKECLPPEQLNAAPISMQSCTFAWPGKASPVLVDVDVTIPQGLTIVTGKVGAGKTAFLQALLGELDRLKGLSHIPNEMVGYCAQTPWLQSMSIRDNILFSAPYHDQRYKRTLEACALLPDLAQFKHGDLSFVGENGIGLSGGQKARVALARAVYSASRVLLLDDPLSALDHNTAELIVRKCLSGPLMKDRTIVLVTHRTALVRQIADQIVDIRDGHATVYDKEALRADGIESSLRFTDTESDTETEITPDEETAAVPDKFIEDEHRAEGGVKARVYWNYIKAGKYRWWLALVLVLATYRLMAVGQSWFLKGWGEAYEQSTVLRGSSSGLDNRSSNGPWLVSASTVDTYFMPQNPMDRLPSPREDVRPWLWAFFGIISFQAAMLLFAQLLMLVIVYCAGQSLFRQVLVRVSHATFRYLDTIPLGRLMNRLTSDIGVVDGNISEQFQVIAFQVITWVSSVLVIATATPMFLLFSIALTVAFVLVFLRFLPTSQSLRRLEMVSLSPLISNFGELLHGLTTVRAFHAEARFQDRVMSVVDKFQGMDHFYWSLQSWLMYRFEGLSAFSTFCLTALALYTNTSPGLVAFVLIAANNFVESTHALCKQYGQLQMDFVSVERVDELLHIEEETPGTVTPRQHGQNIAATSSSRTQLSATHPFSNLP